MITDTYEVSGRLSLLDAYDLRETAVTSLAPKAFVQRREGDSWNAISTNFLMSTGAATEKDGTSIFVGRVGLAVLEAFRESEYKGGY
ncbi:hypothetical protein [Streptomyces sp. H39-C1]|uniref:hypothetical protein n=1 Tax=Streptomyces sp. H39-C1 TaxID=3004355 RepID=UPI0022AFD255|nr:hypothetical protein [Streptomyces sp. H39-C1]MCZ4097299.1 hypothetical protein [Streptomyces sp. H39-C1]